MHLKIFLMILTHFFASKTECESVVVNCETGKAEYKGNFKTKDEFLKCQMASCSVPFICEPVEIDGYHYLDGSIIDRYRLREQLRRVR